jgi:hypothetical protein
MKCQTSCGPCLGKLVHQLLGVITFAYDIHFRCMIAHWKGLSDDYTFFYHLSKGNLIVVIHKKCCLGPQNVPASQGHEN